MKKILILIFLFFISTYSLIRLRDLFESKEDGGQKNEENKREEFERDEKEGHDHPEKMQEYLRGIKIREGESEPGY
jgi:hypothetical protein